MRVSMQSMIHKWWKQGGEVGDTCARLGCAKRHEQNQKINEI